MPPPGLEPGHMASEANALSAELRGRWPQPTGGRDILLKEYRQLLRFMYGITYFFVTPT